MESEHWEVETVLFYDLVAYLDQRIKNPKPLTSYLKHARTYLRRARRDRGRGQASARGGPEGKWQGARAAADGGLN